MVPRLPPVLRLRSPRFTRLHCQWQYHRLWPRSSLARRNRLRTDRELSAAPRPLPVVRALPVAPRVCAGVGTPPLMARSSFRHHRLRMVCCPWRWLELLIDEAALTSDPRRTLRAMAERPSKIHLTTRSYLQSWAPEGFFALTATSEDENAENPDAAKAFVEFAFTREYAMSFSEHTGAIMNINGVDLTENENVPSYLTEANAMINDPEQVQIYEKPHPMSADLETPLGNALMSLMLGNMTAEKFVEEAEKAAAEYRSGL